nr:DUF4832 domain-containing protein [bacterium]
MLNTKQGMRRIPLWGLWDNRTPLENPHKGWYLHYYDNGLKVYFDREHPDDYLQDFPCFNHVYLRMGWCYLEPEEGKYNWELLDEVIRRWWLHDRRVSFRISTKETDADQAFATPKWVKEAGCRGEMVGDCWEPDYGDPIFLEKFGNFMMALGKRYDGAPFLEFVDVGSFGEWGECHTEGSSERTWPLEVMKEHIDMHTRAFKKTPVLLNYDMIALRRMYDGSEEELLRYATEAGLGVRADSGCVSFYEDRYGASSMHRPELFQPLVAQAPMDLELGHYGHVKKCGSWNDGVPMLASLYEAKVTFGGFHGFAREFLADHTHYCAQIGNLMGYWYFPQAIYLPEHMRAGQRVSMGMVWENRGVAPCYYDYNLYAKFTSADGKAFVLPLREAKNRQWVMNAPREEIYSIRLPADAPAGSYMVSVGLFEPENTTYTLPEGYTAPASRGPLGRPIQLALKADLKEADGFYRLGQIDVGAYQDIPYEGVVTVPSLWPGHPKDQTVFPRRK